MTAKERLSGYMNSLDTGHGLLLEELAKEAGSSHVPIIRRESAAFLKTLVAAKQPETILEIGTAVGYSALVMCQAMPVHGHITTIEKFKPRIPVARKYFRLAGASHKITLLEGDADELLPGLEGFFDFIFMDAAKGQYIHWLPAILDLMPVGGVLVSDNVLQDGDLIESRFAVERRNRTIHSRMREFLFTIKHHEGLESAIVPIGDGMTVSVRKNSERDDAWRGL